LGLQAGFMTPELWATGIAAFMGGVTLAFIATLFLNLLYAFLKIIGEAFWN
jgi:hypothetical protein